MGWFKSLFCGVKWFLGVDGDEPQDDSLLMKTATPFITTKKRYYVMFSSYTFVGLFLEQKLVYLIYA